MTRSLIFADRVTGADVKDESVVVDGNVIAGQGLGSTMLFAFEIIKKLISDEMVDRIKKAICY